MTKKIVLISGGKDSTATLFKVLETHSPKEIIGLHCYTGWDSPITLEYIRELEKYSKVKIDFTAPKMTMLDIIKRYKPNNRIRKCTTLLKDRPTKEYLRKLGEDVLLFYGVRRGESKARAERYKHIKPNRIYEDKLYATKKQAVYAQYPIIEASEKEVFKIIEQNGFYPNPLYNKGFKRVGCFPCVCGSIIELKLCMMDAEGKENIRKILEVLKDEDWNEINRYRSNYKKIKKVYNQFKNQSILV